MKPTANTLTATGLTLFILSGSCIDSPEPYNYITGAVTLAGMIIMYLGYRMEEKK